MIIYNCRIIPWTEPNSIMEGHAVRINQNFIERIEKEEQSQ